MCPRSKEQFKAMRHQSRLAILDAALRLFARKGYSETSIADIARGVGSSKGLIYHYFSSKEQILGCLIDDFARSVLRWPAASADMSDPAAYLEQVIHRWFNAIRSNSDLVRIGARLHTDVALQKLMRRKQAEYDKAMMPFAQQLFKRLGSIDPEVDTFILGSTMDGVYLNFAASPSTIPLDRIERHLIKQYCTPKMKVR
jgi:AcrR family transcriptional regulator